MRPEKEIEFFRVELFVVGFSVVFMVAFVAEVADLAVELETETAKLITGDLGRLTEILDNSLLTNVFVSSVKLE